MSIIRPLFILSILFFAPLPVHAATVLDVPFTVQAPFNTWKLQPFKDACEEASIAMIESFYHKKYLLTPEFARTRIRELVAYEDAHFPFSQDTNSHYTNRLINEYSRFWGKIVENPTIDDVKNQINLGRPVIYLAYSPELKNPFFQQNMNPFHVLVIIGYDDDRSEFITHDPGTTRGKNYRYPMDVIMNANRDFQKPNVGGGTPRMIFTEP